MHELKQQISRFGFHDRQSCVAGADAVPGSTPRRTSACDVATPEVARHDSYDALDFLTIAAAALMWLATVYPNVWTWILR